MDTLHWQELLNFIVLAGSILLLSRWTRQAHTPLLGTITRVSPEEGWGLVLTENGLELYFETGALAAGSMSSLKLGSPVEFYLMRYRPGYTFVVEHLSLRSRQVGREEVSR